MIMHPFEALREGRNSYISKLLGQNFLIKAMPDFSFFVSSR
jgi:hypothetical protein